MVVHSGFPQENNILDMDASNQYKKIIESLKLLSLPFEEQKKCLPEFVDVPFEIIDTFDNSILLMPNLIELGTIENKVIANLLRLQNLINFTLSNPKFKDLEDDEFRMADEWNKVREMARDTLQIMGEPIEKPNSNYI
jgi:hypothetical protein